MYAIAAWIIIIPPHWCNISFNMYCNILVLEPHLYSQFQFEIVMIPTNIHNSLFALAVACVAVQTTVVFHFSSLPRLSLVGMDAAVLMLNVNYYMYSFRWMMRIARVVSMTRAFHFETSLI
mmetsp:Transcript_27130/g.46229  ORF Transcript_27130/g.46229 Transcript_27130/m.46229 type:complete len:121 (+) Transcript_27130:137-499(+)